MTVHIPRGITDSSRTNGALASRIAGLEPICTKAESAFTGPVIQAWPLPS